MKEDNNSQFSILNSPLIPLGYKQTEVGVIPKDWQIRPMLSTVRVANGQVDPKVEPYRSMTLVAPDHIESGSGRLLNKETAMEQHAISGKYIFAKGHIVYSKIRPYLRKAILANFDGLCSADMYPLKPAPDVSAGFILAVILGHHFTKFAESVSVRSGMPKINREELAEYTIALPPTKTEQEAISEALSDADALIESLEQLLTKKRHLKQGAMQELLTGKKRLPGFEIKPGYKQTEVGVISQDWNVVPLSKLGKFKNGINKNSEAFGHGNPFVNLMDVFGVSSIASSEGLGLVDTNNAEQQTYDLRKGDVIFIRSSVKPSGVGLTAVLKVDLPKTVYSGFLIRFRDGGALGDGFKRHCFYEEGFRKRVIDASSVSANTNINQDNLKRLLLPLPPTIAEQEAIAAILSDMDAEIAALEIKLAKTRQLKQGMMQELLTGRIRLI